MIGGQRDSVTPGSNRFKQFAGVCVCTRACMYTDVCVCVHIYVCVRVCDTVGKHLVYTGHTRDQKRPSIGAKETCPLTYTHTQWANISFRLGRTSLGLPINNWWAEIKKKKKKVLAYQKKVLAYQKQKFWPKKVLAYQSTTGEQKFWKVSTLESYF